MERAVGDGERDIVGERQKNSFEMSKQKRAKTINQVRGVGKIDG